MNQQIFEIATYYKNFKGRENEMSWHNFIEATGINSPQRAHELCEQAVAEGLIERASNKNNSDTSKAKGIAVIFYPETYRYKQENN